jgi:hypothetical protein
MIEKPAFHSFKDRVYYMKKAKTGDDCKCEGTHV